VEIPEGGAKKVDVRQAAATCGFTNTAHEIVCAGESGGPPNEHNHRRRHGSGLHSFMTCTPPLLCRLE